MDAQNSPFAIISTNDWNAHNSKIERLEKSISKIFSQANKSEFFTPEETAKLLKISIKTLSNWRERNLISFFQVGSNIRFTKEQIEDFVQRNSLNSKNN